MDQKGVYLLPVAEMKLTEKSMLQVKQKYIEKYLIELNVDQAALQLLVLVARVWSSSILANSSSHVPNWEKQLGTTPPSATPSCMPALCSSSSSHYPAFPPTLPPRKPTLCQSSVRIISTLGQRMFLCIEPCGMPPPSCVGPLRVK